ncbi:MAG: sigma 54-interacting transcriptional regulator [Myxococcota bacterium]|nr:sigma 54-interacting transcriptional regulator [Myxococcota bacterium]
MRVQLTVKCGDLCLLPPTDFKLLPLSVGRRAREGLHLDDPRISGRHGEFFESEGELFYQDIGSRNGSLCLRGGETLPLSVRRPLQLQVGDELQLGDQLDPVRVLILDVGISAPVELHNALPQETVIGRHRIVAPSERGESKLLSLFYELSCAQRSEALLRHALGAILAQAPVESSVAFYELDAEGSAHQEPGLWLSGTGVQPTRPSRTLCKEAIQQREALLYRVEGTPVELNTAHPQSVAGLSAALVAPLLLESRCLGVIVLHCKTLVPEQSLLDFVGTLAVYLAARLAATKDGEALEADREALSVQNTQLHQQLRAGQVILGSSPQVQAMKRLLERVARTQATVLLCGETGTGKELAARYLHACSDRATGPFNAVNCAALTENLLQSELFGHRKGAFSGADREHKGLFEATAGGTLLLDEIGEISSQLQVSLLRVLQEGEVRPVGSTKARRVDVRIIAATHRQLQKEVSAGHFREDLYYRLSVFPITLPPLRERGDDILELAEYFRARGSARYDAWLRGFSAGALEALQRYHWPGNIRQLEHEVERAVIIAAGEGEIDTKHLSHPLLTAQTQKPSHSSSSTLPLLKETEATLHALIEANRPLKELMGEFEERLVRARLSRFGENRTRSAESLQISRQALQAKLARWRQTFD